MVTGFWRTRNGLSRLRLVFRRAVRLIIDEIRFSPINAAIVVSKALGFHAHLKRIAPHLGRRGTSTESSTALQPFSPGTEPPKPVVFASACVDKQGHGGWRYSGGIKELNLLVKLLRRHGYEAYMVTYDGSYESWLIEPQPHLSMAEFRERLKCADDVRCVTSYAIARTFIRECKDLYFWDMELALTENSQFHVLTKLYRHKIRSTAAISRTIQAWHMANFERPCTIIPNLLDESLWYPIEGERRMRRVGYMNEGPHTAEYLKIVQDAASTKQLDLEFVPIEGNESEVLSGMRTCEVFLSLNVGKEPLWGEGCPRTILEALAAGCVVIGFDIIGSREVLHNNFNGIMALRYRPDLMAAGLLQLYEAPSQMERLRANAAAMMHDCHSLEARWPAVKEFLGLSHC